MESTNPDGLYEAAARVLRRCANGHHPFIHDVQVLDRHALPFQTGMQPAELAATMIWRIQRATGTLDSGA